MDSKIVNKRIKEIINPALLKKGFAISNSRSFWRHTDSDIHVLNFQSFNSYTASVIGVTTYSYCINLGLFSKEINFGYQIKNISGYLTPEEYKCSFRGRLKPSVSHKFKNGSIWSINEKGDNLDECINDSLKQIENNLDDWFELLGTRGKKIDIVENRREEMEYLFGWGNTPSPKRSLMLSILYYPINRDKSIYYIGEVVKGSSYKELFKSTDEAIKYLENLSSREHGWQISRGT